MIDFVIESEIGRSPPAVFAYVTNATKLATWQTNTVSAVPGVSLPLDYVRLNVSAIRGPA